MTSTGFSTSGPYLLVLRGLHRLHAFDSQGRNEEPEADALRAQMEGPWHSLSEGEKKRLRGLSEDLYSIGRPHLQELSREAQKKLLEALEARKEQEWDKALDLLRSWGKHLDPAGLAFLRGSVWSEAGDDATASLFLEEAARLEPENSNYEMMRLSTLGKSDPAAALAKARTILAGDQSYSTGVVIWAAEICFLSARRLPEEKLQLVLKELISILHRTMQKQVAPVDHLSPREVHSYSLAAALLGFSYDHLGEREQALHWYNFGLAMSPDNENLLVARAILRYGASPTAVHDFQQALRLGSSIVWPYFFLAHHYLVNNQLSDCRRICEQALSLPASNVARSNLFEWFAISQAELGFPSDQVRASFEDALRLDPMNERLRGNFDRFKRRADEVVSWDKPSVSLVQAFGRAGLQVALAA